MIAPYSIMSFGGFYVFTVASVRQWEAKNFTIISSWELLHLSFKLKTSFCSKFCDIRNSLRNRRYWGGLGGFLECERETRNTRRGTDRKKDWFVW